MDINNLKENLNILYNLANMKIDNKNMYMTILEEMEKDVMLVKNDRHDSMTLSLENHMKELGNKVEQAISGNNIDKMYFWIDYIKWSVWETLRENAIGHLSNLKIDNLGITFSVHLNPSISKSYSETKEEYEIRKENIKKKQLEDGVKTVKKNYGVFFEFNEHNKNYLENFIKKYCNPYRFEYEIKDNVITEMKFKIRSDSIFLFNKKEEKKQEPSLSLTNLEIENISNSVKEWYQALSCIDMFNDSEKKDEYLTTIYTLGLTIYNGLCGIFNIENAATEFYKENNNTNKERNNYIRQQEKIIGATFNLEEIAKYFKQTKENIENIIKNNFCFYLDDFYFGDNINVIKIKWYKDISFITSYDKEKEEEVIKLIKNNYDYEVNEYDETIKLLATDKNIAFIQNIIAPRIKSNVDNISISFDENKRYITEIKLINREVKELINL